jgi:hypothetical protein
MNRQRGGDQMKEPRGRMSVSEAVGQAPDLRARTPVQRLAFSAGLAVHTRPILFAGSIGPSFDPNDRVDAIAIPHGIPEPFEHHRDRSISWHL